MKQSLLLVALLGVPALDSFCAEIVPATAPPPVDKSRYTLFNPTPRELMREMSTDRPDLTESPYTVDAGHFQIEMDLLSYGYDRYNENFSDTRVENWSFATANFKVGLCNSTDFQLVVPTYNRARTKDRTTGVVQRNSGFGDLVARLKMNIWGNDGGTTAFGVMPFVKLPTNQDGLGNKAWEGGIIFPLAVALPAGWGMGLMTEVDFNEDSTGDGYHPDFVNTITFGHDIIGDLGGYVEFASVISAESGSSWIGTFNVGFTYGLTENIQLDAGVNMGLTRSADDFNPFLGLSWRF
jgi:hypothetical protein